METFLFYESTDKAITLLNGSLIAEGSWAWENDTTTLQASCEQSKLQFGAPFTSYANSDDTFTFLFAGKYRNGSSYSDRLMETNVQSLPSLLYTGEYDGRDPSMF